MWAQTFYQMPTGKTFVCDAASRYPVTSLYQFRCRGIPLVDLAGNPAGSFFLFSANEIELNLPAFTADPYESWLTWIPKYAVFPPTFTFDWKAENTNKRIIGGSALVKWRDHITCGGRGCQWHSPELTEFIIRVQK